MIIPLQPKLRPKWATLPQLDANGVPVVDKAGDPIVYHVPVLDPDGGQQLVPSTTFHQLFWPGDKTVSQISQATWFSLSKGWGDDINPVSGKFWFIGTNLDANGNATGPNYLKSGTFKIVSDWEWTVPLPAGTKKISLQIDPHPNPVYATLEVAAK